MKNRGIFLLLALTFLLSVFMFCSTAFAATESADGIYAELKTDKTAYAKGEAIDVTLEVKNYNPRANSIRTELVLPNSVKLAIGSLVNDGTALAPNQEANFSYGLTAEGVPATTTSAPTTTVAGTTTTPATTVAGTTAAPTTGSQSPDGPSDTGDISLYIFSALAIFSMVGLILVAGGKNLFKQRWFVMVLCAALLLGVAGPVVANAANDKTFTVSTTITVDGAPVTLEAVISYELLEDADYTEQVEFKKDGQFLWDKDVEMGYYVPSEITYNGQTTTKDDTYRPEVLAPYVDMLFGCNRVKDGVFVSGEFTKEIFNENASQVTLIGLTDDPASKIALELIDKDEWIITVIDGKLVVTGWYDNATAAAARALYALASVESDDVTLTLPMIGKMDYVDPDVPTVEFGNYLGGMDSDFGSVILRWNNVVADDFDAYCAALEAAGYELYESNTMDGFKQTKTLEFATYVKGDDAVLVQYLPVSLLDQDVSTLTSAEKKAYEASFRPDGDEIRLILTSTDMLGNNDAANTGWTNAGITPKVHLLNGYDKYGGDNIGLCEIFTLADGSYIVVDGGVSADIENLYSTLKYMNEREDGKIVVAAWILTHAHTDHTGAIDALSSSEWADEITIEQVIMNHVAVTYRYSSTIDSYGYGNFFSAPFANIRSIVNKFAQGEDYQLVTPHMGQIMKIRNTEVEFITVGDEDMYPVIFGNDNAQSLVFRVTFPETTDQEFMCLADSALDQTYNVFFPLLTGELHAEILTVAHHGLGGQTSRFYPLFTDVEVAVWHTDWATINNRNMMTNSTNGGLRNFDPLDIVCEEYVQTLNIPFNKETDQVIRSKFTNFKSKYQEAEMDITLLPAFRFQGQWAAKKDTIVSYLQKHSADVLILPLIDQNTTTKYNKADLVDELYKALDYKFVYYAPVWGCEADADMETGDGTMGHLILSVYPILDAQTGILVEGTPNASPEGRGYAHVLLSVEGVEVDLVATHFNDAGNWTKFAELYEQWGDYAIIAGNTKIQGDATQVGTGVTSAFTADTTVFGSVGITFANAATNTDSKNSASEFFISENMDPLCTVTANVSLFVASEPSTAPIRNAFANWWVNYWGGDNNNFQKVVNKLKEVNPAVVAFHMVNQEILGMTEDQVKAELGYPYAIWVPNNVNASGQTHGHWLVSHYPIEDLGTLEVSDGSDDYHGQRRAFGHALLTINDTEIDVWYGTVYNSTTQIAKLEAAVSATASATGRPFIISTNDAGNLVGLTSFAGCEVYNYSTSYMSNVLVSKGKVTVTGTDTADTGIGGGVDVMNILDLEISSGSTPTYYNVSFHANGGTGTMAGVENVTGTYTLPTTVPFAAPNGKIFAGWATDAEGKNRVTEVVATTGTVDVYAVYANPKVMSWWINFLGGDQANADAIMDTIKAEKPGIALLLKTYSVAPYTSAKAIADATGYPYYYSIDFVDGTFQGHLILSQFPLTAYEALAPNTTASQKIAFCSAKINGQDIYLLAGTDIPKAAAEAAVIANIPADKDFIFCYHKITDVMSQTTYANRSVKMAYGTAVYTGMVLSTTNVTYGDVAIGTKPAAATSGAVDSQYLTVEFTPKAFTVSFDQNGGTGSQTSAEVKYGDSYALPTSTTITAPAGMAFAGWATDAAGTNRITSLEAVTENVTVYPVWASTKVMSWWINFLGGDQANADAIMDTIKAEKPGIALLLKTYSVAPYTSAKAIADATGYPYYYSMDFVDGTFQGHLILSQFPLTAYEALAPNTTASQKIAFCSAKINGQDIYLLAGTDIPKAAAEAAVIANIPADKDFIFCYHKITDVMSQTTYANRSVKMAYGTAVYTGMVLSTTNVTYGDVVIGTKPAAATSGAVDSQYLTVEFTFNG